MRQTQAGSKLHRARGSKFSAIPRRLKLVESRFWKRKPDSGTPLRGVRNGSGKKRVGL